MTRRQHRQAQHLRQASIARQLPDQRDPMEGADNGYKPSKLQASTDAAPAASHWTGLQGCTSLQTRRFNSARESSMMLLLILFLIIASILLGFFFSYCQAAVEPEKTPQGMCLQWRSLYCCHSDYSSHLRRQTVHCRTIALDILYGYGCRHRYLLLLGLVLCRYKTREKNLNR